MQAATAKAGDTVYDTAGEVVGTVESVEGDNFIISTGTSKATLPLSALADGAKGPTIGMNKMQLDAAIQQANQAN
jgi:preprotein translocase subunit YajC